MATDKQIIDALSAMGMPIPRITPEVIESTIVSEHYFTASEGVIGAKMRAEMLVEKSTNADDGGHRDSGTVPPMSIDIPSVLQHVTMCVIILNNGTKIVGVNYGPVIASAFDAQKGRELARADAVRQVYPLLGYMLRDALIDLAEQHKQAEGQEAA